MGVSLWPRKRRGVFASPAARVNRGLARTTDHDAGALSGVPAAEEGGRDAPNEGVWHLGTQRYTYGRCAAIGFQRTSAVVTPRDSGKPSARQTEA